MKQLVQLSGREFWLGGLSTLMLRAFYSSPAGFAEMVSTAAPWVILLSGGITALCVLPVALQLRKRPGQNLADLAIEAGGHPLGIGVTLAVGLFAVASSGLCLRQLAEMTVTAFYPLTPQTVAVVCLAVACVVGARAEPATLVWAGSIYALPAIIVIMFVLMGNFGWANYRFLLPVTGHGVLPSLVSALPLSSHLGETVFGLVFIRLVASPERVVRDTLKTVLAGSGLLALVTAFYLMVFPLPHSLDTPFGLFDLTRLVQGGRYVERFDAFWVVFWATGTAGYTAASLQGTAVLWQQVFRMPDYRPAILPLTVAVVVAALIPSNQADAIFLDIHLIHYWAFIPKLLLPAAVGLLLVARRRRRHA